MFFFTLFSTVYKNSKPSNFLLVIFLDNFLMDSKSASNSVFFYTHIENICNKYFWVHISALCKLISRMSSYMLKQLKTFFF
jgi:hypothetical protein